MAKALKRVMLKATWVTGEEDLAPGTETTMDADDAARHENAGLLTILGDASAPKTRKPAEGGGDPNGSPGGPGGLV